MKMNTLLGKNLYRTVFLFVLLALVACGPAPVTGGKSASSPASLKPGHWTSETGAKTNVSFDLTENGGIRNFTMSTAMGAPKQTCTIEASQARVEVDQKGAFVISYIMEYADIEAQVGKAVLSLGVIPKGKPYEVLHIEGKAANTTMDGEFKITVCGETLYLGDNTGPWKAHWEKP